MNKEKQKQLDMILREGKVIDVDFSTWEQEISLAIETGFFIETDTGSSSYFILEFRKPTLFHCRFSRPNLALEEPAYSHQWNLSDFDMKKKERGWQIILRSYSQLAELEIECEDVLIRPFPRSLLDRLFPNWNRSYAPLVRPGLLGLAELFLKKGNKR